MRGFAEQTVPPAAAEWDEREETPWPVIQEAAKIGLYSLEGIAQFWYDQTGIMFPIVNEELFWGDAGIGKSMGGRVALEIGLSAPDRVRRLALLAPSLAWLRSRPWAPYLKLVAPQLGLIQPAPRAIVEGIVRRVVPGSEEEWTAAGIDELLRSYLTPRGRAAFYAAARNIYLEEPYGPGGFWTRLPGLAPESLFVWGRRDPLVPIRFARHVREALPHAAHLELRCGHVPQLERPKETHEAILRFLADGNQ